ncbi:mucin-2-like isoform X1 [Tigriopus californicus]|nr:mucin-2-like isoform X1 [Tigriopus californicus]
MDQSACGYQFQYKCTNPVFPPSSMDVSAFITTAGDHKALLRFPPKSFVANPLEDGRFEFSFDEFLNMSPDIPEEFVFHYHVYQNGRLVSNITEVLKRGDDCQGMSTGSEMELITAEPSPVTVFQAAPSGQVPNMSAGITIRGGPLGIDFITFPPEEKYIPHNDEFYNDIEDLPQTNPPEETQNTRDRADQSSSHEPQVEIRTSTRIDVEAQTKGPENSVTVETFDKQPINENEIPETPMPKNSPELPGLTDITEIFAVTYGPADTIATLHTNGETDEPHKDEFQVPSTTPKSYITTTPSGTLYSSNLMPISEAIGLSSQPIEFPTQSPVSEIQSSDHESTTPMGTSTLASENSDTSRSSSLTNSQASLESTIKPKILELQTVMSNVPSMVPNFTDGPSEQQENSTDHQILDSHNSSVPSNQLNSVAPKYASSSSPALSVQQSTIVAATEVSGSPEDQSSTGPLPSAPLSSKVPTTQPLPGSPPSNPGPGSNPGGGGNWQMAQVWRSGKATLQPR